MKKILVIMVVVTMLLTMSGCVVSNTGAEVKPDTATEAELDTATETNANDNAIQSVVPFEMELVGESKAKLGKYEFYRESLTDVIYVQYRENYRDGGLGLTALLDPKTRLPMTYAKYQELVEQTKE